ncbi:PREDICTED: spermatogenesis-associated protein 7 [Chrysochloris asiatica]|uniref:Spermatogenesis-associated protein 7 n=1 Tax=Chrysochloris asiatica TaxID=185453 RepID=A0A9B0WKX4_CHRAS|nr:PREDICTED: spermatogenesis-associated protein 7 [Chrysochloris asiatica]
MEGSRRVLPRYGSPYLFKGHLSTKSNAFCTDSSSLRLNSFHLVRSHMTAHYNKIIAAKAAIDCSVPLSMCTSIKYADQQRREKLKRELAQCEKELRLAKTTMQTNAKPSSKSLFNTVQKPSGEPQDEAVVFIEEVNGFPTFSRSPVPSLETLHLGASKADKVLRNGAKQNSHPCLSSMDYTAARARKSSSGRGPKSTFPNPLRLAISKAPSGDLLDKHSEFFSNNQLPFTPRTLKTEAKSFLSQYRYYTPAKRKKAHQVEAETQTELSSFNSDSETAETEHLTNSETNVKQAPSCVTHDSKETERPLPSEGRGLTWDDIKDGILQHSSSRTITQYSLQPSSGRKIHSDEEELLYLSFIEDITDEILKLGLFSNRFLERLFERHVKENKHHLEEAKMRHLLQVLKVNLGFLTEQASGKQNDADMVTLFDCEKAEKSQQNEFKTAQEITIQQERREYQKALDMLLSVQKEDGEQLSSPGNFFPLNSKPKRYSTEVTVHQVSDERNLTLCTWNEKHPSVAGTIRDHETSMSIIKGDSDTEKVETSNELAFLRLPLSQAGQSPRVTGDNTHELEGLTLHVMERNTDSYPLKV